MRRQKSLSGSMSHKGVELKTQGRESEAARETRQNEWAVEESESLDVEISRVLPHTAFTHKQLFWQG